MKTSQKWQTLALAAAVGASAAGTAWADPEFDLRGRVHLDAAIHDDDETPLEDGVVHRRGWLGVDGTLSPDWSFRVEYNLQEGSNGAQDVYLKRALPVGSLTIGNAKVPMGMNTLASSNNIPLIERSAISNIVNDGWRAGLKYELSGYATNFQAMAFSRALDDDRKAAGDDGNAQIGAATRFVTNPFRYGDEMIHLGVSTAYEDRGDYTEARFGDRPESRPDGTRLIDTGGDITDLETTLKYGVELAYQNGPFSAEAEYLNVDLDRRNHSDPSYDGYHIQASYVLTGEARSYNGSTFGGITPASPHGAWELTARFSHADLSDSDHGEQDTVTLGLNHYVTSNLRFMGNLIHADVDDGIKGDESVNLAVFRAAYHF